MQKSLMEKSGLSSMIEKINSISNREDFIEFLKNLATDYTDNNDAWENVDFQILARILYMGKIYE